MKAKSPTTLGSDYAAFVSELTARVAAARLSVARFDAGIKKGNPFGSPNRNCGKLPSRSAILL